MTAMLPTIIELEQAHERQERAVAELLETPREITHIHGARRAIGRWFMAVGARLAAEPPVRLAGPRGA
jgi:hypothetical protein